MNANDANAPEPPNLRQGAIERENARLKEIEMIELDQQYQEIIRTKSERFEKMNAKLIESEKEITKLESEIGDLKEKNQKLKKAHDSSEISRSEESAIHDIEIESMKTKYDDLKKLCDAWRDIDTSTFWDDGQINKEHLQKILQLYNIQRDRNEKDLDCHIETIKMLECQLNLYDRNSSNQQSGQYGLLSWLKGSDQVKKIEQLQAEIRILKEKEEKFSRLTTFHQLKLDIQTKIYEQTKKEKEIQSADVNHIKELEEALTIIKSRESAIEKMNKHIDELEETNGNLNEKNSNSVKQIDELNHRNHKLEGKLSKATMEYDQLEQKYKNAIEEINNRNNVASTLTKSVIHLQIGTQTTFSNDKWHGDTQTSLAIDRTSIINNNDNTEDESFIFSTRDDKEQVYNQCTEVSACPNCGCSMPVDELESHIDPCLSTFC